MPWKKKLLNFKLLLWLIKIQRCFEIRGALQWLLLLHLLCSISVDLSYFDLMIKCGLAKLCNHIRLLIWSGILSLALPSNWIWSQRIKQVQAEYSQKLRHHFRMMGLSLGQIKNTSFFLLVSSKTTQFFWVYFFFSIKIIIKFIKMLRSNNNLISFQVFYLEKNLMRWKCS